MPEQNWGSWAILDHTPENPKFPSFNQFLNDEEQKSADDLFFKGEITSDIDYYNTFGAESDGTNKLYWEELKKKEEDEKAEEERKEIAAEKARKAKEEAEKKAREEAAKKAAELQPPEAQAFGVLGTAQTQANDLTAELETQMPTTEKDFPYQDALADMRGTMPSEEKIKQDLGTEEEEEKDDLKIVEEVPESKELTASEGWMADNFPVIHENQGYVIEFHKTDDFPFDDKYKRYVMNPEGKYSTLVKKRKSKRDQKKYGTYEEQFVHDTRKGLVTFHMDKLWPDYMNTIEKRLGLEPTYVGPALADYPNEGNIVTKLEDNPQGEVDNENSNIKTNPEDKILEKEKLYNENKKQIKQCCQKSDNIKGELTKLSDKGKGVLGLLTGMLGISNVLTAMDGALKGGASAGQSVTSTMKTTYPSHPGPGNLTDATTVNKVDDISNKSSGFSINLAQQLSNLGNFIKMILDKIKAFLKKIIPILIALISICALAKFLQQLAEFLFLGFLKDSALTDSEAGKNTGKPDEFLNEIGYPGYDEEGVCSIPGYFTKATCEAAGGTWSTTGGDAISELEALNEQFDSKPLYSDGSTISYLDNTPYIGYYHIHQEVPMEGPYHSSQPHVTLKYNDTPGLNDVTNDLASGGTCSIPGYTTQASCEAAGGIWTPLVTGTCSIEGYTTKEACEAAGGTWTSALEDTLGGAGSGLNDLNGNSPIVIGGTVVGTPITDDNLNFDNHSVLGDLTMIHPHIVNELYEEGILPKETKEPTTDLLSGIPNATTYQDSINNYYENALSLLQKANKIEYIRRIKNAKFEYVGYKRYKA